MRTMNGKIPLKGLSDSFWKVFLLNRFIAYPLSTMTLLKADCLTPIQLSVRSECYLFIYLFI